MIALILFNLFAFSTIAKSQSTFGGGNGTEEDPYIITTVAHMQELATNVNSGTYNNYGSSYYGYYFRLDADLDFSGVSSFYGIGIADSNAPAGFWEFGGFFDGNGHVVRNLNISSSNNYKGLFNVISAVATVKDLTLVSSSITGQYYVGGIVGYMNGDVFYTDRGVRNCKVADDVTVTGQSIVGGIVGGTSGKSDVIDCVFLGTVTGNSWVGAITGYSWAYNAYTSGNTNVNPSQHSQNCFIGGNCTKGAIGVGNSTQGTDENTTAKHIATVTFDNDVSGSVGTMPLLTFNGTNYYECGTAIDLSLAYTGTPPAGYIIEGFLANGTAVTKTDNGYTVTLPSLVTNVNITANSSQAVRDIGYEPWISITTPSQEWTGSALTPAVTVTDSQSGSPVTLQQGVDYSLSPEGGFVSVGSHNITVIGMGNYGGQATTVFNITNPSFTEGSGTETDPFIIRTVEQMEQLAVCVNNGDNMLGVHFRLGNDLDYTEKTITPIGGGYYTPFRGTFDGNYHTISNITLTCSSNYQSLFYYLGTDGTVRKLTLDNSTINCNEKRVIGGIVAWCNGGTIEYCTVTENVSIINGNDVIGGIVGQFDRGVINYCSNAAIVSGYRDIGGIVGYMQGSGMEINGCFNSGNILGTASDSMGSQVGGIAGLARNVSILGCINTGNVVGHSHLGGIAGLSINSTLTDNLNLAKVSFTGNVYFGGVVGYISGTNTLRNNYYAGLCTTGGINGSDVLGQAMKGWIVSNDEEEIFAQQWPIDEETGEFVGITFDGIFYVGAGETTKLLIEKMDGAPEGIIAASAGVLKPLDEEYYGSNDVLYLLTMPAEGGNVNLTIAEGVGLTVAGYDESANAGWRFIASPVVCDVAAGTVSNIFDATQYDLYRFNQSVDLEWENYKQAGEHYHFDLENGRGYLYATKEEQTLVFRGTYNTAETQTVPLTFEEGKDFAGWNLVGNPFATAATVNKSYYVMNEAGTGISPTALSEGTSIAACTGIIVKADAANESVTFGRVTRQNVENKGLLHIVVDNEDKAIVSFNDGDALEKYVFGNPNAKIYIPQNGKEYAIATVDGRDTARHISTNEIPINFKAAKNGTYTLNMNVENMDLDYLHLIDNMTGADVDLLVHSAPELVEGPTQYDGVSAGSTTCYTFTAKTTDYASRFRLVFNADDASTDSASDAPFAYISNGEIIIMASAFDASLQVVDVMGRVIRTVGLSQCGIRTIAGMTPGVYVLRLIDGDSIRTQKIIID